MLFSVLSAAIIGLIFSGSPCFYPLLLIYNQKCQLPRGPGILVVKSYTLHEYAEFGSIQNIKVRPFKKKDMGLGRNIMNRLCI